MAQFTSLPNMPGVRDLASLIEFLNDKKRFESHMKDLDAAYKKLKDASERVTKAKDIAKVQAQTHALKTEALSDRSKAAEEAKDLTDVAKTRAAKIELDCNARVAEAEEAMSSRKARLEAGERGLEAAEKDLVKREKAADTKLATAEKTLAEGLALKAEFSERTERLREAVESV